MKNIVIIVAVVVIFLSCNQEKNQQQNEVEKISEEVFFSKDKIVLSIEQYDLSNIDTGRVYMLDLHNTIRLNGVVNTQPGGTFVVSAPLGGYIRSNSFVSGSRVEKGQLLLSVENIEFVKLQQQYLEATEAMKFVDQEYKRQQQLRLDDVNSKKTLQKISSEYNVLQAQISGLGQQLEFCGISPASVSSSNIRSVVNVYSPFSGYVKQCDLRTGSYVQSEDVLLELINPNKIQLTLNAFQQDISKIKSGELVRFATTDEKDYHHRGVVSVVGKSVSSDGVVSVSCSISRDLQEHLLVGMYVKAIIETQGVKSPAVPLEAVVNYENQDYIVVMQSAENQEYTFSLVGVKKELEYEGFCSVILPASVVPEETIIVTDNAYAVLSAFVNSFETDED